MATINLTDATRSISFLKVEPSRSCVWAKITDLQTPEEKKINTTATGGEISDFRVAMFSVHHISKSNVCCQKNDIIAARNGSCRKTRALKKQTKKANRLNLAW